MLEDFYSQHNKELARILSDEAFTWRDTARKRALIEMEEGKRSEEARGRRRRRRRGGGRVGGEGGVVKYERMS